MRLPSSKPSSLRIALTALILIGSSAGLSACRLGANNTDKLTALKSGEIYDEDGVVSVAITTPESGTLINLSNLSSSFAVSGTCGPEGSMISLQIDGVPETGVTPVVCAQGAWALTFDATALSDGDHALTAWAERGGKSKSSSAVTITKDVSIPELAILSPSSGSFINASANSATFAVSGTCSESDQYVSVLLNGVAASSQNGGVCNGTTWAATINTLSLSAGAHTLQASMTSASGNAKTSENVIITKDVTAPTVAIGTPTNGAFVNIGSNSASYAVSGTCNDATASVQVKVDGSNSGSAASCGGTNWSATISTVALSQGAHTLTAQITDPAGNSATSSAITITKDTVAPPVAITAPATSSYVNIGNNSASFAIQGSCTTADENGRTITIQVNGSNASQSAIACGSSDSWSGTFSTTALGQGAHTLSAILSDAAGNSSTSAAVNVTKDTSAPSVTLTYPVSGSVLTGMRNSATFPVKGTCTENSRAVTILVNGAAASNVASNTCTSSAFSATIDTTGLSEGTHTITATQADAAGNTGPSTPPSSTLTKATTSTLSGAFTRNSVANDPVSLVQAGTGVARYPTVSSASGILLEESTTNLLTATLSNVDAGTTGFTSINGGSLAHETTDIHAGAGSLKVTTPGSVASEGVQVGLHSVSASTAYTYSAYLKGSGNVSLNVEYFNGASYITSGGKAITLTNTWTRYDFSFTTPASTTQIKPMVLTRTTAQALTFYVDTLQLEQKAYGSSWITGGTTRAMESYLVPTAGSITPTQGAIIIRAYVDGSAQTQGFLFSHNKLQPGNSNQVSINRSGVGQWRAITSDNSNTHTEMLTNQTLSTGFHTFGLKWNSTEMALWIDGAKANSVSNPSIPSALGTTLSLGAWGTPNQQWNQPIDWAAFYQHAPTDPEMDSYTGSGGPVKPDNRLDFNASEFSRTSAAYDFSTGAIAASGAPRFATSGGRTGLLIEEATTNLLTANQSSAETDLTGIDDVYTVTKTRDTSTAWNGTASVKIVTPGSIAGEGLNVAFSTSTQGTYTASAYAKGSGNLMANLRIQYSDASFSDYTGTCTGMTSDWKRLSMTGATDGAKTVTSVRLMVRTCGGTHAASFYADGLQIEQKAFATSWHIGGSTRNIESFILPLANNVPASNWTVELTWIPKKPASAIVSQVQSPIIFEIADYYRNSSVVLWDLFQNASGAEPRLYLGIKGQSASGWSYGPDVRASGSGWYTIDTPKRVAVRCTGNDTFHVFFEGTKYGPYTISDPVVSWNGSYFRLGTHYSPDGHGGAAGQAIFDELRISTTARTDAELQNYTNGSASLGWDANTSVYLDFNGSIGQ